MFVQLSCAACSSWENTQSYVIYWCQYFRQALRDLKWTKRVNWTMAKER